jgi:hypothetical protein
MLPILEFMQTHWENMAKETKFHELHHAISKGLDALRKYYSLTDQTSVYIICLGAFQFLLCFRVDFLITTAPVLNPNIKMEYFNRHWDDLWKINAESLLISKVSVGRFFLERG